MYNYSPLANNASFQNSALYLIKVSRRKFPRLGYITLITEFTLDNLTTHPTIVCEKHRLWMTDWKLWVYVWHVGKCISYFPMSMIKHHNQEQLREGRVHPGWWSQEARGHNGEGGMASGIWSRKLRWQISNYTQIQERAYRKRHEATNIEASSPPAGSTNSPNNTINWGLGIQTHDPVRDILHSNHHRRQLLQNMEAHSLNIRNHWTHSKYCFWGHFLEDLPLFLLLL